MARLYARNFQCSDQECSKSKKDLYKWDDDLTPVICECGKEMFEVTKDVNQAAAYLRFNSLSPEGKAKILKARSHDHFNREIKEKKHEMLKATKRDFFNH